MRRLAAVLLCVMLSFGFVPAYAGENAQDRTNEESSYDAIVEDSATTQPSASQEPTLPAECPEGGETGSVEGASPSGEALAAGEGEGQAGASVGGPSSDAPADAAAPAGASASEGEPAVSGEDLGPSARAAALPAGERVVEDGVYSIACSSSPSHVLDVADGSQEEGANVTLWTDRRDQRQLFRVQWRDGYYSITALHSGQSLDVVASGCAPGTNVTQWGYWGTDNQLWSIERLSDGSYRILSKLNGLALSSDGAARDGSNVMVTTPGASGCLQSWSLSYVGARPGERVVEDGVYSIACSSSPSHVLDVADGSQEEGANVTLWTDRRDQRQLFRVQWRDGYYSITALHSGQSLDVVASGCAPGTNVTQWGYWGTDNQLWSIERLSDGSYRILSKLNGLALSSDGAARDGSNVMVTTPGASGCLQSWSFVEADEPEPIASLADGIYTISNHASNGCVLDVVAGSKDPGANVTLYSENANLWQRFRVTRVSRNYYKIVSMNSNQALDVVASSGWPDANVTQWPQTDADNQLWILSKNDNGTYTLTSKCSGLVLGCDLPARSGSNVKMETPTSADSQQWDFSWVGGATVEDGVYTIANAENSNYVLDVVAGGFDEGANVTLYQYTNVFWQRFKVTYEDNGYDRSAPLHSGQTLELLREPMLLNGAISEMTTSSGRFSLLQMALGID